MTKKLHQVDESPTGRLVGKGPNIQQIRKGSEEYRRIREVFVGEKAVGKATSADPYIWRDGDPFEGMFR